MITLDGQFRHRQSISLEIHASLKASFLIPSSFKHNQAEKYGFVNVVISLTVTWLWNNGLEPSKPTKQHRAFVAWTCKGVCAQRSVELIFGHPIR